MARKPARIHLHFVPVEGATELYAVEVRQGRTARTIGRVSGSGSSWIGLLIGGRQWGPWVKTRREATAPLLAAQRLQLAGKGTSTTLFEVLEPGDVVEYRGSITLMHDRYILGEGDGEGRWTLLYELTGDVALRRVRRESFSATGEHVDMSELVDQVA
jgi:hypothetical protein